MTMTRRDFTIRVALASTLGSLSGCVFGDVYKNIEKYVPVALLAFDRITMILMENGVVISGLENVINMVKAALADIQTALLEYHDAAAHDKATLIQAISVAMKIATHRLIEFWDKLSIPNQQLALTIKTLLDIIISTLTGFIGQLSPGTAVASQKFLSAPRLRSVKEFRDDFNGILRSHGMSKYAI